MSTILIKMSRALDVELAELPRHAVRGLQYEYGVSIFVKLNLAPQLLKHVWSILVDFGLVYPDGNFG